jgi:putative hydrolase of the HAD superfamily
VAEDLPRRLAALRAHVPIGLVTDGDPAVQRSKLRALGLADAFDAVVISDAWGRAYRKPHRLPFDIALGSLGVEACDAVFIGDRPDKDVIGATRAGMRAIRVRTGEYAGHPNRVTPWGEADDVIDALGLLAWEPSIRRTPGR